MGVGPFGVGGLQHHFQQPGLVIRQLPRLRPHHRDQVRRHHPPDYHRRQHHRQISARRHLLQPIRQHQRHHPTRPRIRRDVVGVRVCPREPARIGRWLSRDLPARQRCARHPRQRPGTHHPSARRPRACWSPTWTMTTRAPAVRAAQSRRLVAHRFHARTRASTAGLPRRRG